MTATSNGTMAGHARQLLDQSFVPVPNRARTKKPCVDEWVQLRRVGYDLDGLFPDNTDRNIGVLNGEPSAGFVDIDLDCKEARAAAPHLLPRTDMVWGRQSAPNSHYGYRVGNPPRKTADSFDDPTLPDDQGHLLEIRSTGGQTIVPPSIAPADTKKGKIEEPVIWYRCGDPAWIDIVELERAVRRVSAAALIGRYVGDGRRHKPVLALCGGLLRANWPVAEVKVFVRAVAVASGGGDPKDLEACVETTAERLGKDETVEGWPTLAKQRGTMGNLIVSQVREWLGLTVEVRKGGGSSESNSGHSVHSVPWPEPLPLTVVSDVPPFPVNVLPRVLRAWAEAQAEELQVPVELPAFLGMGMVSAGIARKGVALVRPGFSEPVNTYAMIALQPGERKTQTFKKAIAPVRAYQKKRREEAKPVIAAAESERRLMESRLKHLEGQAAKETDPDVRNTIQEEAKALAQELADFMIPPLPLLVTDDDTPESLAKTIAEQGGRLFVAAAEGTAVHNIRQYSDKPNLDIFLKGHGGDDLTSGRVGRGRSDVDDPALSCALSIQPDLIAGLAEVPALRGRGFLARWLFSLPLSIVGRRQCGTAPVPPAVADRYADLVTKAWETTYDTNDAGEDVPHILAFTPSANEVVLEFERWIEPQLAADQPLHATAGWANKLTGEVVRVAVCFHVAEALTGGRDWATPVGPESVERAVRLAKEYLIPHAMAAFAIMGTSEAMTKARKAWARIVAKQMSEFSKRDLQRDNRPRLDTPEDIDAVLAILEKHDLVRPKDMGVRKGPGQKPSPVYEVNPRAWDRMDTMDGIPAGEPADPNSVHSVHSVQGEKSPHQDDRPEEGGTGNAESNPEPAPLPGFGAGHVLVTAAADLGTVTTAVRESVRVGLDVESTGLDPLKDRIRLLTLDAQGCNGGRIVFVIDLFSIPDDTDLRPLFDALAGVEVVGHNLAFDIRFLARHGFVPGKVFDTLLASQVLDAGAREPDGGRRSHKLEKVLVRELGITIDKSEQTSDWSGSLTAAQLAYAAADVRYLVPLADAIRTKPIYTGCERALEIEIRALPGIASAGPVTMDRAAWLAAAAKAKDNQKRLAQEMDALVPNGANLFSCRNWNSPDQVVVAFASVGVTLTSTDDDTLAGIDHPLAATLRNYRAAAKLNGTYGRKWLDKHAPDGVVLPNWHQCGTDTGRMSCSDPNLQQVPREDPTYRQCFIAPPGKVLVKADYSQIELRIAAVLAGDERMLQAYRDGEDLHTLTATNLTGKKQADVTKADRQLAKAVNFGLLYGMGPAGLQTYAKKSFGVGLSLDEAKRHRDGFFALYPGLEKWHAQTRREVDRRRRKDPTGTHVVYTLATRPRVLALSKRTADGRLYPNLTEALNTPVQGTGADGLKAAIAHLWERRADCPTARPVLFVHDEIVVEVPETDVLAAKEWLVKAMTDGMAPLIAPVPVVVDVTEGQTWGG
jgi:DNA polymerase-1